MALQRVEEKTGLDLSKDVKVDVFDSFREYGELHVEIKAIIQEDSLLYKNRPLWSDVAQKEILAFYEKMILGEKAKTVILNIYIAQSNEGTTYLYIFY